MSHEGRPPGNIPGTPKRTILGQEHYGVWSIPKGEVRLAEDTLSTARREFEEEPGIAPPDDLVSLGAVTQKGGKTVEAWAFEGNCDPALVKSNTFVLEWPPRSGKTRGFSEIDRAEFFEVEEAKRRINAAQSAFLPRLTQTLAERPG